jgi:multicomponent Na+:H+ antiporter subunit D
MLITHLPVLQVVAPLVAAPVCLLLNRPGYVWIFTLFVTACVFAGALLILEQVLGGTTLSYALGAWGAPWGIEYRIDTVAALLVLVIASAGLVVMPYARNSIGREIAADNTGRFYACFLLCLSGLLGIVITADAFNLFVFLEISSLSCYVLISLGPSRRALTASFQYLVMGTIGATFILIGVGLLYMMTGTLNMADLAIRLQGVADTRTIRVAFAFITVGVSLKLALFPLHLWLPNAYAFSPSMVSAFIAATMTKVGIYVLLRFFFTVFGAEFSFAAMHAGDILLVLAVAAMLIASLVAVFQEDIKRMLAYSSIAHIGYIILGISLANSAGLAAGMLHIFNHAMMKGTLFMAMGCIFLRIGSVNLKDMHGLARRMPLTMAAFVTGGLGLVGVPLTAGFVSKWYLVVAALESGYWPLAVLILVSSLIALVYVWRVIEVAYFQPAAPGGRELREAPLGMLLPTCLLAGAVLYFGIDASFSTGIAQQGAAVLLQPHISALP